MIKPVPAGAARANFQKSATRPIAASKGQAFADALKKPLQREFESGNRRPSEPQLQSDDTRKHTEKIKDQLAGKNLQYDRRASTGCHEIQKELASMEQEKPDETKTCDGQAVSAILPVLSILPGVDTVSAVRTEMGSINNVVRIDELSGLINRLNGHLQLSLQNDNGTSPAGVLQSENVLATFKTPEQTAASQWTVHLVDKSQALKSIRLQLDAQGQWRIALDMKMHTTSRPSGAIAQDLQSRLAKDGHRISKLTIMESADESEARDE